MPPAWQPSRYGQDQRPKPFALAASVAIVGAMVASLLTTHIVATHKAKERLTIVEMKALPEPSPPPPQHRPEPAKRVMAPSPVVAPPPLVQTPAAPATITTSPEPPPAITISGPPSPAPVAVAGPGVESDGDLASKMIAAAPPRYPQSARRNHEQGVVLLMVLVGTDGGVENVSIHKSSGFRSLDQAALAAVQRWRWSPAVRNGAPVMLRGIVEIPFILKG